MSSNVCCFDEELSLTSEVDSSTETDGSLAEEDLKKQRHCSKLKYASFLSGDFFVLRYPCLKVW